jgi:hypothetical protein
LFSLIAVFTSVGAIAVCVQVGATGCRNTNHAQGCALRTRCPCWNFCVIKYSLESGILGLSNYGKIEQRNQKFVN